jgi:alkylation response protein AidB-like acyl-CoA dehydrogenase
VLHMMRNLELERLALAAMSLGIARRSIEIMNKYARDRSAFGQPLANFGQIQRHIAESYAEYQAGRAYTYNLAAGNPSLCASRCWWFAERLLRFLSRPGSGQRRQPH